MTRIASYDERYDAKQVGEAETATGPEGKHFDS